MSCAIVKRMTSRARATEAIDSGAVTGPLRA